MINIPLGLAAGFVATVILSMGLLMKRSMRVMPEFGMIGMLGRVTGEPRSADWVIHFLVGIIIYGIAIALLSSVIQPYWLAGIVVGALGWLIASVTLMPAAGKGPFGLRVGTSALFMAMAMHLMFGLVLGLLYGWFV